jgi:hypothetical protein
MPVMIGCAGERTAWDSAATVRPEARGGLFNAALSVAIVGQDIDSEVGHCEQR